MTAARRADADDFLAGLPEGYETMLGREFAGGYDLSIGQWQRVALARAFFRDAPLVILDEPTAALDARAESRLFDRSATCSRTVRAPISHRSRASARRTASTCSSTAAWSRQGRTRSSWQPASATRSSSRSRRARTRRR